VYKQSQVENKNIPLLLFLFSGERRKGSTAQQHQIVPCASWCASLPTMMDKFRRNHKEWCWPTHKRKKMSLESRQLELSQ